MTRDEWTFWLTLASAGCWLVCFWWMHIVSVKQNALLAELKEQGKRIERLSKDEHDLLQEVHPQVGQIHAKVQEVAAKVDGSPPR
jgi:hypothetical protein